MKNIFMVTVICSMFASCSSLPERAPAQASIGSVKSTAVNNGGGVKVVERELIIKRVLTTVAPTDCLRVSNTHDFPLYRAYGNFNIIAKKYLVEEFVLGGQKSEKVVPGSIGEAITFERKEEIAVGVADSFGAGGDEPSTATVAFNDCVNQRKNFMILNGLKQ